jgi:predicted phosphodiesterase
MKNFNFWRSAMLVAILTGCLPASAITGKWAVVGDAGDATKVVDKLRESVKKEKAFTLVMPGDNLYRGSYAGVWDVWKKDGFAFESIAIGNHNGGYSKEIKYFGIPGEYYSVVKNGARFIVLNSNNTNNVDAQFKWLETEIAKSNESFVFLVYHHPTYTVSQSHKWSEKKQFQLKMRDFLKNHRDKITALLLGHDHMSEFALFGELPAVIAGSGREVRKERAVSYSENGLNIETKYLAPETQHWALLETDSSNGTATIHFIRVKDQTRVCTAIFKDGKMTLRNNCTVREGLFHESI